MVFDAFLLNSIVRYESRVSGAIQAKKYDPPLLLGLVFIEKEAFGSLSTMLGQLIYTY